MDTSTSSSRDVGPDPAQEGVRLPTAEQSRLDATDVDADTVTPQGQPQAPVEAAVEARPADSARDQAPRLTRTSAAWAAVVAALLVAVVLIVFILQNPTAVVLHFLGWSGSVAIGVAMLIAAVAGGLLVAAIGVARLTQVQLRARQARAVPST